MSIILQFEASLLFFSGLMMMISEVDLGHETLVTSRGQAGVGMTLLSFSPLHRTTGGGGKE